MEASLVSGSYDIVANGTTFLFQASDRLEICLYDDEYIKARFLLQFLEDDKDQRMDMAVEEDKLVISCWNFKDTGTGLTEPKYVASVDGRKVYIIFWSYVYGEKKLRRVEYTIFQEQQ